MRMRFASCSVRSVMQFILRKPIRLVDSSRAKRVGSRSGVGRLDAWSWAKLKNKEIYVAQTPMADNPSDLGTNVHPASRFNFLLELHRIGQTKAPSTPERKVGHTVPKAAAGAAAVGALCATFERFPGASAHELVVTSQWPSVDCNGSRYDLFLMVISAIVLILAVNCAMCCAGAAIAWRWNRRQKGPSPIIIRAPERIVPTRTMSTQSMVTYERYLSQPRFKWLQNERLHGAWEERD